MRNVLLTGSLLMMPALLPGEGTSHPIAVVDIDHEAAEMVTVRTVPFKAVDHPRIGEENAIHVGATADTMLLLGMINHGWDHSLAHWGEHPETWDERIDQIHLGVPIGHVEVHYSDGDIDTLPLVIGATAWFVSSWARGSVINPTQIMQEPFKSRPDLRHVLDASLRLNERDGHAPDGQAHTQFYLSVSPRQKPIDRLVVHNNTSKRGQPLVSGVTLLNVREAGENIIPVSTDDINWVETHPRFALNDIPDFEPSIEALAQVLYTSIDDLPRNAEPLDFPIDFDMARLTFHGELTDDGVDLAGMLNNYWVANLIDLNNKFEADTGFHRESGWDMPYYGGYQGLGTWGHVGIYGTSYSRCSDHFVTMALRVLRNQQRVTSYVDYVDDWLTFFRTNNDPSRGIANHELDADRWPADAPGHWGFILENPLLHPWPMNELQGTEEMDGHGSITIARWWAWRLMGAPTGDWLTKPRADLYGMSRYDSAKEAANFITWFTAVP